MADPSGSDQEQEGKIERLLQDPAFLFKWKQELDRFITGENESKLLLTLVAASSYTSWNLSAIINGSSSSGKSHLKKNVLRYFDNVESYTRLTKASPDRLGQDFTKKILDVEELRGTDSAQSTLRVWISEGNLKLLTTSRDEDNKLTTEVIETKGSPSFITTTTYAEIDDELLNRVFIISLDETKKQTENIIRFEAKQFCKLGDTEEQEEPNKVFNTALSKLSMISRVVIPYADCLATKFPIPKGAELSISPRRDFKKLLYLIGVVAWLHQMQRLIVVPNNLSEQAAKALGKQFVVASSIDFFLVWRVCRNGFLSTLFKLSERHKRILENFKVGTGKTVRDVAEEVSLSENRTREFLNSLVKKGYLSLDRSQKTYVYCLKQKNELDGSVEDFETSLNVFQETELQNWLEAHKYKILLTPLTPPSFVDPLTGEVDSAKRIMFCSKSEQKEGTKTEIEPSDSTKSSTVTQERSLNEIARNVVKLEPLVMLSDFRDETCAICHVRGIASHQITLTDGSQRYLCQECSFQVEKELKKANSEGAE